MSYFLQCNFASVVLEAEKTRGLGFSSLSRCDSLLISLWFTLAVIGIIFQFNKSTCGGKKKPIDAMASSQDSKHLRRSTRSRSNRSVVKTLTQQNATSLGFKRLSRPDLIRLQALLAMGNSDEDEDDSDVQDTNSLPGHILLTQPTHEQARGYTRTFSPPRRSFIKQLLTSFKDRLPKYLSQRQGPPPVVMRSRWSGKKKVRASAPPKNQAVDAN